MAIGGKNLESVAELFERRIDDLEIAPLGLFVDQLERGNHHFLKQEGIFSAAPLPDKLLNGLVEIPARLIENTHSPLIR